MSDEVRKILDEREKQYGNFSLHAELSQKLFETLELHDLESFSEFEPYKKEALMMICTKLARIINGDSNHIDSWKDIGGYAQLVVDALEKVLNDAALAAEDDIPF